MQSENAPAEINKTRQFAELVLQVSDENNDDEVDINYPMIYSFNS